MHINGVASSGLPDSSGKSKGVPPGLARRELDMPPGIAKKLDGGVEAPSGILKRFPAAGPVPENLPEPIQENSPADGQLVDILA